METVQRVQRATLDEARTRIISRYIKAHNASEAQALAAWQEFVKFLSLCGLTQESLAPSRIIDDVWHEAILHTREYQTLCNAIANRFVHHVPNEIADDRSAYKRTLILLAKNYGTVDTKIWPSVAEPKLDCGSGSCSADDSSPCSDCGSRCTDN